MPMDTSTVIAGVLLCCTAVFFVASTSIARECYNKNSSFATSKGQNSQYLNYMLAMGVCCILTSFAVIYLGMKHGDKVQAAINPTIAP
jgi:ABC-type Fe3+ transport system permease subunit